MPGVSSWPEGATGWGEQEPVIGVGPWGGSWEPGSRTGDGERPQGALWGLWPRGHCLPYILGFCEASPISLPGLPELWLGVSPGGDGADLLIQLGSSAVRRMPRPHFRWVQTRALARGWAHKVGTWKSPWLCSPNQAVGHPGKMAEKAGVWGGRGQGGRAKPGGTGRVSGHTRLPDLLA